MLGPGIVAEPRLAPSPPRVRIMSRAKQIYLEEKMIGDASLLTSGNGGPLPRLRRLCDCTRALAQLPREPISHWLDAAAAQLSDTIGVETAVAILVGRWDARQGRWLVVAAGAHGINRRQNSRADRVFAGHWPDDEFSIAAGHTGNPPTCSLGRLADLVPEAVWRRCAYRRLRDHCGLGGGARWMSVTAREPQREALLIQLEDLADAGGPPDEALEELAVLAPQVRAAYEDSFLVPELRREQALSRLTPAQRRIARMLLAGHSQVDIARKIGRTYHTVRGHVKAIYDQLDVHSCEELVFTYGSLMSDEEQRPSGRCAG
jgi:DNA-binding CsgD family transcriptional regulator